MKLWSSARTKLGLCLACDRKLAHPDHYYCKKHAKMHGAKNHGKYKRVKRFFDQLTLSDWYSTPVKALANMIGVTRCTVWIHRKRCMRKLMKNI